LGIYKGLSLKSNLYGSVIAILLLTGCTDTGKSSNEKAIDKQKIFIIGDSTVHSRTTEYLLKQKGMSCGKDNPNNLLSGWGDGLSSYMKYPQNLSNQARQGSNSLSFKTEISPERYGIGHDWQGTVSKMRQNINSGFLLIQFGSKNENGHTPKFDKDNNIIDYNHDGHGDKKDNQARITLRKSRFKENIRFYINQARELSITPILITVAEARVKDEDGNHRNTRGAFPSYMIELAKEEKVELLDLHSKTLKEFSKYSDKELLKNFGDCTFSNGYIDRTHYEPQGAKRVAGYVKELACEMNNPLLCNLFK